MLLESLLEKSAARAPDRLALVAGANRVCYAELEATANRLARGLRRLGVRRGDRVAVYLDSGVETIVALFAALKAGAAFMMVNPTTKEKKLDFVLENARASALILPSGKLPPIAAGLQRMGPLRSIVTLGEPAEAIPGKDAATYAELTASSEADTPPDRRCIDLDLAGLMYTSGSTGEPKGVMLTHRNIVSATRSIVDYLSIIEDDVLFNVLPLSFGYGLTQLFSAFATGARFVVEKGMVFPHVALSKMADEKATGFAIVPTIAAVLLGLDLSQYDLSSLRYVTNAGAGIPPEHAKRLSAALPKTNIVCMYGQTECLRISYLEPKDFDTHPDSVGKGMPNQEHFIVDDGGVEVGPNVVGELVVRGSHVMRGYWELPAETEKKLRPPPGDAEERAHRIGERALYTGDLFKRDDEGFLYFVARKDDIIKSRGEKVSPREVENVLVMLEGVAEAAVVGIPDAVLGQAIKAVVVPKQGVTLQARQVQRHCAMNLEDFMVPSVVEFRDELPKNERGKVAKREL